MIISIVTTLYNSSPHILEFHNRMSSAAQNIFGDCYEIIFVNDGSPDNSLTLAIELSKNDERVLVIDLSRNFGQHKALMTGLRHSKGDFVFILDGDLEEKPEWLIPFYRQMQIDASDVVYGIQKQRRGSFFDGLTGNFFYYFLRLVTRLDIPNNITTARIMSRRYVDALLQYKESETYMAGLWAITGFKQTSQLVEKLTTSQTTYTPGKKIYQAINSITSFSNAPLFFVFMLGCSIFVSSIIFCAYLTYNWLFLSKTPEGYTSLIISIWLIGGLIISLIGILGIYIAKIYAETKNRPNTIIKSMYRKND